MLKVNFDANSKNNMSLTPFYTAIKCHNFGVAEILLNHDKNMFFNSPDMLFVIVTCAIEGGSLSLVKKIFDHEWINDSQMSYVKESLNSILQNIYQKKTWLQKIYFGSNC